MITKKTYNNINFWSQAYSDSMSFYYDTLKLSATYGLTPERLRTLLVLCECMAKEKTWLIHYEIKAIKEMRGNEKCVKEW